MNGDPLNPALCDLVKRGIKTRDSDIIRVIRYLDIRKGYKASNKIVILLEHVKNSGGEKKEELKAEVKVMLTLVDDTEEQLFLHSYYLKIKQNEKEVREMLEEPTTNDLSFIKMFV